jgi:thiol-disulfide isomerase/thioredoxin
LAALLLALASAVHADSTPTDVPATIFLIHHPGADPTDPFGYEPDAFATRYEGIAATGGVFDYPSFVADGVIAVRAIPNQADAYASTRAAYLGALQQRSLVDAPVRLHLESTSDAGSIQVHLQITPRGDLQASPGQTLQAWIAIAEDNIHYQPPSPVSNGVTNHRFTVRAHRLVGSLDAAGQGDFNASFPVDAAWNPDRLTVAAWIQADAGAGRFQPNEVVQAVSAKAGATATADTKVVLAQLYSATWCPPCLYGDLAMEDLAIQSGAAAKAPGTHDGYVTTVSPLLVIGALGGAALAFIGTRRP